VAVFNIGAHLEMNKSFFLRRVGNIPWMKIDPGVNLPWGSKYHMTPILSSFITYHRICNQINTSTTCGTGAGKYCIRFPQNRMKDEQQSVLAP
jgi:hypothetical protein